MGWMKTIDPAATAEATGTAGKTLFRNGCGVVVVVVEVVVVCVQLK
jgi:hypothetical protein